jgi:hypothetical protein
MQAPDPDTLEKFLGRVPMVFNVVIVSPHGYFGQANVLGMPDTGGQVRPGLHMRGKRALDWLSFKRFQVLRHARNMCLCLLVEAGPKTRTEVLVLLPRVLLGCCEASKQCFKSSSLEERPWVATFSLLLHAAS